MNAVLRGQHISLPLLVSTELAVKVQKVQVSVLYIVWGCGLVFLWFLFSPAVSSTLSYLGTIIDIVFPVMAGRTGSLVVLFHLV